MSTTDKDTFRRLAGAAGLTRREEALLRKAGERIVPLLEAGPEPPGKNELAFLDLFFYGPFDETFPERRRALDEIGGAQPITSHSLPGGYDLYLERIPKLIVREFTGDPGETASLLSAVTRALILNLDIACLDCAGQSVHHVARQRDDLKEIVDDRTEQLRISEAKYRVLIDNYPEMIIVFDREGKIVDRNGKSTEYLVNGENGEGIENLFDLVSSREAERVRAHVKRVIEQGHDRIETVLDLPGGETRHAEMISTALCDGDGSFLWARSFLRDLTDRKRFEAEMIKWERLVAVGSMAAKVAHEIRNPLSSISLNVELLQDEIRACPGTNRPNTASLVTSILYEVDRLSTLIEEYLTFGRLPKPSVEPVDTGVFLRSLADFVRRDFEDHNCRLAIDVRPATTPFYADPNQAKQVMLNLLRNALDAMPGGGLVTITAGTRDDNVMIDVRDTGVGIEKEKIRSIFDPMYTTKDFGTGLGLPFVQQVMREHGGRVTCFSEEGEGTVFSLCFPAAQSRRTLWEGD